MARKIDLNEAMTLVGHQMKTFTPAGVIRMDVGKEVATLEVTRGPVQGSVILNFRLENFDRPEGPRLRPLVRINIPAFNDDVLKAVAQSALFTELTAFGVVLQMMLDEYQIPASRKS